MGTFHAQASRRFRDALLELSKKAFHLKSLEIHYQSKEDDKATPEIYDPHLAYAFIKLRDPERMPMCYNGRVAQLIIGGANYLAIQ